jgi:short-subunit dehydrogenase
MTKQVALITGASSGIGKETARLLHDDDFEVYAAARRLEKMEDIRGLGVRTLRMDISDDVSMVSGVNSILSQEGRIDVLVNNAGYGSLGSLEDTPMTEAKYQFEVNLFGMARLCQLVIPTMRGQGSGKIINVTSIGGKITEPHACWYHASKFAAEGLSDCLRMELKQFGIDVIVIEPGSTKTEWSAIARENLANTSGTTIYRDLVLKHLRILEVAERFSSKPSLIAKVILKAVHARNPRPRYAAGRGALILLGIRKTISDSIYDRLILGPMKRVRPIKT